jgi:hypothetical protein
MDSQARRPGVDALDQYHGNGKVMPGSAAGRWISAKPQLKSMNA